MNTLQRSESAALAALISRRPQVAGTGRVEQFVLQYIYFEALLRVVLTGYRSRPAARTKGGKSETRIIKSTVSNSFAHFGIAVHSSQVDDLLDSTRTTRGAKSARELRNALVHGWKEVDAAEVEDRAPELLELLQSTIHAISKAASNAP